MTQEELDRLAIANEVFGESVGTSSTDEEQTDSQIENQDEYIDPWSNVDPVIRTELDILKSKLSESESIEERLKQTERRLGSVLNELHAAKETAKQVTDAPTKEQMIEANINDDSWNELKEDFPEWAQGIESKLAANSAEMRKELPDVVAIRDEISREFGERYSELESKLTGSIVSSHHKNWRDIVQSDDFQTWRETNGVNDTNDAAEAIASISAYNEYKKSVPTVKDIKAEREQRLKTAENVTGRKINGPKSEADMTEEELRASIAASVWGR